MSDTQPMIEINGVTKCFGDFTAVNNVSLTVQPGEFITLLGPSGCGKTTLLRMLSGFEHPDEGSIRIAGEDVTHLAPYRRNVNQVFQSYALFPHLSVYDNIAFGLRMQKVPEREVASRVAEAIALVAMQGFEQRRPQQLSGGQRQRVALARAIAPRPQVLLLDEPLSALDAKLRHQMQLELKHLQKQLGLTFVFVTHDQEEALTMSDRIAVFSKGRIEQLGTATEVYHHPRTAFVADFIGEANLVRAEVVAHGGDQVRARLKGGLEILVKGAGVSDACRELLVSIRPEKVSVSKQPFAETENVFRARVVEEVFQGVFDRLWLETEAGTMLTAVVANESALHDPIHAGDDVWCGLHADDIVIVNDSARA